LTKKSFSSEKLSSSRWKSRICS